MANAERNTNALQTLQSKGGKQVMLTTAADVEPMNPSWLWKYWVPAGFLSLIAGAPATGKTSLALSIAATLSRGGEWPDGAPCRPQRAVIWSGEDDVASTLVPRLMAHGANLEMISFVTSTRDAGETRSFDPARDLLQLRQTLCALDDVGLLIIDPIISVVSGDSHKNAEVRRGLQPVVELASTVGCAVLGITHLSKGTAGIEPLERVTGSLAFGALPRIVLFAARTSGDGESEHDRILVRAKSNIGPDGDGFRYGVEGLNLPDAQAIETSRITWGSAVSGPASDLLSPARDADPAASARDRREEWLRKVLSDGPVLATEVSERAADELACSVHVIGRVRERVGAISAAVGYSSNKKSYWYLPGHEGLLQRLKGTAREVLEE